MNNVLGETAQVIFHSLPRFKGRWRLLRLINRIYTKQLDNPIVDTRLKLGYRMKIDLRSRTEYEAFYTGEYDRRMISTVMKWFRPGWLVLDVGANVGFYSVPFGLRLKALGSGTVHCFEPVPSNFTRLNENIELNDVGSFVHTHAFGLSNQEGQALMTLREDFESGGQTGNASILIEDGQDARFKTVPIPLKTLDQFVKENNLERLDYLKADIEGHEDMLFEGGWQAIKKFRPVIQAELNEGFFSRKGRDVHSLLQRFRELNYAVMRMNPSGKLVPAEGTEKRPLTEDLILVPAEKSDSIMKANGSIPSP